MRFVDIIDNHLAAFFAKKEIEVQEIAHDLVPLVDYSRSLLSGGKRFRARFAYWGYRAIAGRDGQAPPTTPDHPSFILATALEMFHAAALVHDDIMDKSDTRRGEASAHRHFESLHRSGGYAKDPEHYGTSAALMVGDLLLAWSSELVTEALSHVSVPAIIAGVRGEFHQMWNEVTLGQFLDIHEESCWPITEPDERFERAMRVVTFKSAKYSMEAPLRLGAALAGAGDQDRQALADFGLPLGVAFQLRDDVLGAFGDPEVTGKPSGDDLREGKRTVLIALAEATMSAGVRRVFEDMLGDPEVTPDQISVMQSTLSESGALEKVEEIISRSATEALGALDRARIDGEAAHELRRLADAVVTRQS